MSAPVYHIKVTSPWLLAHPNHSRILTDGRDEGGAWFTYSRDVADQFCAGLNANAIEGVSYEVVTTR